MSNDDKLREVVKAYEAVEATAALKQAEKLAKNATRELASVICSQGLAGETITVGNFQYRLTKNSADLDDVRLIIMPFKGRGLDP